MDEVSTAPSAVVGQRGSLRGACCHFFEPKWLPVQIIAAAGSRLHSLLILRPVEAEEAEVDHSPQKFPPQKTMLSLHKICLI